VSVQGFDESVREIGQRGLLVGHRVLSRARSQVGLSSKNVSHFPIAGEPKHRQSDAPRQIAARRGRHSDEHATLVNRSRIQADRQAFFKKTRPGGHPQP
jgi:hypothetical protein